MALSTDTNNRLGMALGPGSASAVTELTGNTTLNATGDVTFNASNVSAIGLQKLDSSTNAYIKTDAGVKTLLAAAAVDRRVQVDVVVTTTFANGDGAQPTLTIGQTGAATKFAGTSDFSSKAATNASLGFAGTLTANTALIATLVAGTGTTETGAYTIVALAVG